MTPLIETLETSLWLRFLIDATMKSLRNFRCCGVTRIHSAPAVSGGARFGLEFGNRGLLDCTVFFAHTSTMGGWRFTGNTR